MAKVKYIPVDIYKRCIYVFIGTLEELRTWIKKEYCDSSEEDFVSMVMSLKEEEVGMASFNWETNNGTGVILLPEYPESPKEIAALTHELLHATFFILDMCHVDYNSSGSNEAFTYLMEYLTRNGLEKEGYEEAL